MNNYKTYLTTWQRRYGDSTTATITTYAFGVHEHTAISRMNRVKYDAACRRLAHVRNTIAAHSNTMDGQRLAKLMNEERQLKTRLLMK